MLVGVLGCWVLATLLAGVLAGCAGVLVGGCWGADGVVGVLV